MALVNFLHLKLSHLFKNMMIYFWLCFYSIIISVYW